MKDNLYLLRGVSDFAPGAFENTAVEAGCIQLGQRGGEYITAGSYTSPAIRPGPFVRLLPSWNTDTPAGTFVEIQARIASGGQWSRWLSFGEWSPFIHRASRENEEDELAQIDGDTLVIKSGSADLAQLRVLLNAEADPCQTPQVYLLGATFQPEKPMEEERARAGRELQLPEYSCLVRDPSIASHIASVTALTMLINRFGQDALPEETARAMYDDAHGWFGNLGFITAAGGMFGYECYSRYCGIDAMRREVQHGHAVAARIHYRAPALGAEEEADSAQKQDDNPLPVFEPAVVDSSGHLVAVRGFITRGEEEMVVFNDPYSDSNSTVRREVSLATFRQLYTGTCIFLHRGPKTAGKAAPERRTTHLELEGSEILLTARGERLRPGENIPGKPSSATIMYALSDGIAYASAAQKKYYYLAFGEDGHLPFDKQAAEGHKMIFYLVGSLGTTWVGEKQVEEATGEDMQ